jgi:hypothetical protein
LRSTECRRQFTICENFTTSGSRLSVDYRGPCIIDNLAGNNVIEGTITTRSDGGSSLITVNGGTLTINAPGYQYQCPPKRSFSAEAERNGQRTIADNNVMT